MSTRLCHQDALAEGQARGLVPGGGDAGERVVLLRHGGRLHAWRDNCPHQPGTPLAWRRDAYLSADGRHLVCHAHGARFDPATGACLIGPALGQSLCAVPITIDEHGEVHLADAPHHQETPP